MRIDNFQMPDGIGDVNRFNASTAQANHFPETALRNQINRSHTEARSQNGVGEPPRWMCPSTLTRTSLLASVAMAFPIRFPTAPARRFSLSSGGNLTPAATITTVQRFP